MKKPAYSWLPEYWLAQDRMSSCWERESNHARSATLPWGRPEQHGGQGVQASFEYRHEDFSTCRV